MRLTVIESSTHCIHVVVECPEKAYLEHLEISIQPVYPYTVLHQAQSLNSKEGVLDIFLDGTFIPGTGLIVITYRRLGDLMDSKLHYSIFVE